MKMLDVSDYHFHAPNWLVIVRSAKVSDDLSNLAKIARDYADGSEMFLEATNIFIGTEEAGPDGGRALRITADLPAHLLFAGMLKFGDGRVIELSLIADKAASGAEAEFERLLASARASDADGLTAVHLALQAKSIGSQDYPAGPLRLDLTSDYRTPHEFTLESTNVQERYTFGKTPTSDLMAIRDPFKGSLLAENLEQAVGDDGRVVKFEVARMPRFNRGSTNRLPTPDTPRVTAAIGFTAVNTIGNDQLTVRFEGSQATAEKAAELLRTLNSAQ